MKLKLGMKITPTQKMFAGFTVGKNYEVVHINKGSLNPKIVNDLGYRITVDHSYKIIEKQAGLK